MEMEETEMEMEETEMEMEETEMEEMEMEMELEMVGASIPRGWGRHSKHRLAAIVPVAEEFCSRLKTLAQTNDQKCQMCP